jgi:two-component system, sensor histidine kinase and response regulator
MKHGGTGLGLAITSRLVEVMGGTITVDSVVDQWTEFLVQFPHIIQENGCHVHNTTTLSAEKHHINSLVTDIREKTIIYLIDSQVRHRHHIEHILKQYGFAYHAYDDVTQFVQTLDVDSTGVKSVDNENAHPLHLCLIQEDLVSNDICHRLSLLPKFRLIPFGLSSDRYGDRQHHNISMASYKLRSLNRMLPYTLVLELHACLKAMQQFDRNAMINQFNNDSCRSMKSCDVNDDTILRNLRILIAEDNKINQKVLVRILNRLQIHNIVVVENGQEAVDQSTIGSFDIILMDLHMPVMDGLEACKLITSQQKYDSLLPENSTTLSAPITTESFVGQGTILRQQHPTSFSHRMAQIIFLTAHVSDAFENECYKAGATSYLSKPCSIDSIGQCFRNLIQSGKLRIERPPMDDDIV